MGLRKELKRLIRDYDVRDLNISVGAITDLLAHTKGDKKAKPLFQLTLRETGEGVAYINLQHEEKKLRPFHVAAVTKAMRDFAFDLASGKLEALLAKRDTKSAQKDGESQGCGDPNCIACTP